MSGENELNDATEVNVAATVEMLDSRSAGPALSDTFADTLEALLAGEFICEYRWPYCYDYLRSDAQRDAVNDYLVRIRRVLRQTTDGVAWYAASREVDELATRKQLQRQFAEVIQQLEPLTRWLSFVMSSQSTDMPLSPGELVKEGALLSRIEDSAPLADELQGLVKLPLFASTHSSTKGQLSAVLASLCSSGYLLANSETGSIYTATGKWSYLYEVMEFIASHEALDTEPEIDVADQRGLAL